MKKEKREKIDFKHDFSIYFSILKKYLFVFIAILFICLLVEGSYTFGKYLFKHIIEKGDNFTDGLLGKNEFIKILLVIAGTFLGTVLFRVAAKWIHINIMVSMSASMIFDLKKKFFNHLLYLSHNFHSSHKSGSLISRLTRGGHAIDAMTDVIVFEFSPLVFQFIIVGTALMTISWIPALVILLTISAFISYSMLIQNLQQTYNLRLNTAEDYEKGLVSDVFTNIDSIKYYGKEKMIGQKFKKAAKKSRLAHIKHWLYFRWWDAGHAAILGFGAFFLMLFPVIQFLDGKIKTSTLVLIFTLYGDLIPPLFMFVFGMRNFYRAMADFDSLFQYAKIKNSIKDKKNAKKLALKEGLIEFKNISFKFHNKKIFENFNLKINPNEKVALVGHSGSGKSTLVKLLYRFYDVDNGKILVDNHNIKDLKQESLRSEMAIVPQDCILFDDTIYNNIAFSNPDAKRKDIINAMKSAQLYKVIDNFADKEETIVGERGVKLSGGEKQRVSIARALLANKKIVVLDEATSALDSQTEYDIQQDLKNLLQGRTAIIIAHRLSTIMNADRVIVMENGKIVQSGKHSELIKEEGVYKNLWDLQKDGYIE